ncbi:ATP-binding region ATPase domain protein [Desulforamulus ruminis DSM 2154]|uniref:histidine kinase n=2 Tax=Desulforamulus ruminis TaxID=1564 RepID=F6DR65_DESRL|nr:ATP-binding region ATPase domain protein [Desulforamulus ruminis DSM 2154]
MRALPQTKKAQMAALIKINNITGYLPLNLQEVLRTVGKEMEGLFQPYKAYFHLDCAELSLNQTGNGFEDNISYHHSDIRENCRAIKEQLPVIVYDSQRENCGVCKHTDQHQSHICVPLVSGFQVFGTLSLKSCTRIELEREQLELLLAITNQTTATIQRARLFNRLEQEKEMLEKANRDNEILNQNLKNTIRQLKAAQHQLILSERLAAAGHLAANFAHEINNPTGNILSRLECLELEAEENPLPETLRRDLAIIKKHVNRIAKITHGLLVFSRQSLQQVVPVRINELILETVDWLEQQFSRKNICFTVQLGDLPPIKGNQEQLHQVLVNLLTNARDAMPKGGVIKIITTVNTEKKELVIDICDRGSGISARHMDKIFDPFFTTKEAGKGTGLGLSISYSIVQEHGGRIEAESVEGVGTTFSIKLPLSDEGDLNDVRKKTDFNH